jgi:hypothetical protein
MPPIFKALATVMAWVLWIVALVTGFSTFAMGMVNGVFYGSEPVPMSILVSFAVALAYGIGAVVVMLIRKKLE